MIDTPCNRRIGAYYLVRFASLGYYKTCLLISDTDLSRISKKSLKATTRYQNDTKRRGSSVVKHWKASWRRK